MKRLFKKNQIIVTMLAVLIAVAGYLNYADKKTENTQVEKVDGKTYDEVYGEDTLLTQEDIESLDEEETTVEPGAAILTNGTSLGSYMVQARLDREQTRSKNKELLMEVVNNEELSESEKKKAVKTMVQLTENSEKENTIETLLKAKGFSDVVVTITDEQADIIIDKNQIDDAQRAQIEEVVKRKTNITSENIIITPAATE